MKKFIIENFETYVKYMELMLCVSVCQVSFYPLTRCPFGVLA